MDIISHIPILCEENDVEYAFVDSKVELGRAAGLKTATTCLMILQQPLHHVQSDYSTRYNKCVNKLQKMSSLNS